ncbi:protein NLRC3 [Chanos chanos]|uniref:Protein NLRC3-like n=1 Tax=Chanos chanos TaxID=29144 RepID=A0A6J2VQQ3_CHACN|nr:protein NLRC3-like [Chanos chanos]XP_030633527.1 protein NLRC3-like [Chanos chanos]
MSLDGSDNDSEVERICRERPPSSYGSMQSEDHDEEFDDPPESTLRVITEPPVSTTRNGLHRSDSPQTEFTERTQGQSVVIPKEGAFLNEQRGRELVVEEEEENGEEEMEEEQMEEEQMEEEQGVVEEPVDVQPPPEGVGLQSGVLHLELRLPYIFKSMQKILSQLNWGEMNMFKRNLCSRHKNQFVFSDLEESDVLDVVDKLLERCEKGEAVQMATRTLQNINKQELAAELEKTCRRALIQYELRLSHKRRYYCIYEGVARAGQQIFINYIYVEPLISIGGDRVVNMDHEVRRAPPSNHGTFIRPNDIFRPLLPDAKSVRTVLMTGPPAIGNSVAVQKFIVDWTDNVANQDFQFVFPLPGRELNLVCHTDQSLLDILTTFYTETRDMDFLQEPDCSCLFIIDGFEMCNHPLDFQNNPKISDIKTPGKMDALLTSLLSGTLLPHAKIWVTGHRFACRKILPKYVDRLVELRGFTDEQKDEYFTKRAKDLEVGARVLAHVKRSRTLYLMCHMPLFCWIVAYVYERAFRDPEYGQDPPNATNFYTQYVIVQTNRRIERFVGTGLEAQRWRDHDKEFLRNLGKLALRLLESEREDIQEKELTDMGFDLQQVASRCGLLTEVVERPDGDARKRTFRFIHFTLQEYMAALYVYLRFRIDGKNVFEQPIKTTMAKLLKDRPMIDLYRPVVDRALASRTGHLDLFLRFLFGLVCHGTEDHLRGLLMPQYPPAPRGMDEVEKFVNKKIRENASPERCRNLQLCLDELREGRKKD